MKTIFQANDFEMVKLDHSESSPSNLKCTDDLGKRLVRAMRKSDLPRGSGLKPVRLTSGYFGWRIWALSDDWGNVLASRDETYPCEPIK